MQNNFFFSAETATRYNTYRPVVHGVIAEWLAGAGLPGPYRRAIDVACGTGHSTLPLQRLAQQVDAIDISPEMVAAARARTT